MDDASSLLFSKLIFPLSLFALDLFIFHRIPLEETIEPKSDYHSNHLVSCLEIVLLFTGRRRSSVGPDRALQEALRTRLRVVESNSQDVIQLFKVSDSQT